MQRTARSLVLSLFSLAPLVASGAAAQPLQITYDSNEHLLCLYAPADSPGCSRGTGGPLDEADFSLPGAIGTASLVSERRVPAPGSAIEGLVGYEYYLDLRHLVALTAVPCIWKIQIHFGPVVPFDFDGDGIIDQVYVLPADLHPIAPTAAEQTGNDVSFIFDHPICAGTSDGRGGISYVIGLLSTEDYRPVSAEVFDFFDSSPVALPPAVLGPQIPGEFPPLHLFLPSAFRAGRHLVLHASGARPGAKLALYAGAGSGKTEVADCPGVTLAIAKPALVAEAVANAKGRATFELTAPESPSGSLVFQVLERPNCEEGQPATAKAE